MRKFLTMLIVSAITFLLYSTAVMAQFTVTGKITDENDEAIIGANVLIKNTTRGTVTDIDGMYSIEVSTDPATLVFSSIGYETTEKEVTSTSGTLDIQLGVSENRLDAVVVSGLATSVKRRNSANSVAAISAKELTGVTRQSTMDGALYGKFKGATINSNSGAPGGGISVRLRGLTSINGSTQPLYIVDGVFVDNSTVAAELNVVSAAGAGGSRVSQDNPSNRIADIDPEDIENIEILKGASAAAIYGSRAAGGVVIITTKRGEAGKTKISVSQTIGQTSQLNKLGVRNWTAATVAAAFGDSEVPNFEEAQANGRLINYEDELYGNKGLLSTTRVTASGGNEKTKFFLGGTYKNEEGIVKNTGYEKTSFRFNIDHKLTDWLSVSSSNNYIWSSSDRGFFNNDNSGTTMGISFVSTPAWADLLPDENGIYPNNPYSSSNFLQTRDLITNNEQVSRFISGLELTAKVFSTDRQSLKLILKGGLDTYSLATTAIFPRSLQFMQSPNSLQGASVQGQTRNTNTLFWAFLVHDYIMDNGLSFRTSAGLTGENFDRNTAVSEATSLVGLETNVDQSANRDVIQERVLQRDRGFFLQEEINFDDKIIATLGLRGDKSSNNGDVNKLYYYPKASLAANIHKFVDMGPLSQLKLRAAFGQSGNFAVFGSKYTSFNVAVIQGVAAPELNLLRGNPNVAPERQTEIEFGADFGFNNDKVLFDATYYIKNVDDLLLEANVPTSSGFERQVTNAAELQNSGVELGLTFNYKFGDLNWGSRLGFWKNQSKVTRLDIPAYTTGAFGATLGSYYIQEGQSATQIVGIGDPALDEDGDGLVVFGDAEPDFNLSFQNSFNYKDFELSFLWHWKKGGDNVNLSTLLSDLSGTSPDYDNTNLDPNGELNNGDYRVSQLGSSADVFVEDASYVRLREIGLFYRVPKKFLGNVARLKIGFSGNNLLNFFSYNSYDPEVSNFGGNGLSTGIEVTPFPSAKRWNFHIVADF